ncbi:MAG: glycosyltransferase family 39 protein [Flavipsychrobacter sp.]|nr:glycosyltransferase family 39 protein [Flavipsychrobacter sp.]
MTEQVDVPKAKRPLLPAGSKWVYLSMLACILLFTAVCRLRLLDVPFERDEGEYAYAGQELLKGIPPFVSTHHVKLPGMYGMNAVFIFIFGHSIHAIHLGLLLCNLFCIVFCYAIARKLFDSISGVFAALVFALFTLSRATFGFTGNAEHFVLLFSLPAIWLLLRATDKFVIVPVPKIKTELFCAGLLFGLAYMMKQHALYFVLFAVAYCIYKAVTTRLIGKRLLFLTYGLVFAGGVGIPILVLCLIFRGLHLFDTFWWWTFYYPRTYVTQIPLSYAWLTFKTSFKPIWHDNWPVLILSFTGGLATVLLRKPKHKFFLLVLTVLSTLMVAAGLYFYPHYFLNAAPVLALLAGAGIYALNDLLQQKDAALLRNGVWFILPVVMVLMVFINRDYYFNDDGETTSRTVYGGNIFPESIKIGEYLQQHTRPTDKIAIFGSEPQIYFYANRSAATGYIYTYEMTKDHPYVSTFQKQMADEVAACNPVYVVMVNISMSWFATPVEHLDNYIFEWANKYIAANYIVTGMVDVRYPDPSVVEFDRPDGNYQHNQDSYVLIFKRKSK